jgi:hypothetical protein
MALLALLAWRGQAYAAVPNKMCQVQRSATCCNAVQRAATQCNVLQHSARHGRAAVPNKKYMPTSSAPSQGAAFAYFEQYYL